MSEAMRKFLICMFHKSTVKQRSVFEAKLVECVHRTCLENIEFSPCFHHGSLFIITFLFVSPNQEYYLGKSDFAITFSSMSLANLTLVPECTKRKTRRMLLLHVSRSTTLFKPNEKTVNIENEQINARRKLKLNLQ